MQNSGIEVKAAPCGSQNRLENKLNRQFEPPKQVFLQSELATPYIVHGEASTLKEIAEAVLAEFFKLKGFAEAAPFNLIVRFIEEFLGETPPGNLVFPYSELNSWYKRLIAPASL